MYHSSTKHVTLLVDRETTENFSGFSSENFQLERNRTHAKVLGRDELTCFATYTFFWFGLVFVFFYAGRSPFLW